MKLDLLNGISVRITFTAYEDIPWIRKVTKAVGVNVSDGAFDDQDWNTLN